MTDAKRLVVIAVLCILLLRAFPLEAGWNGVYVNGRFGFSVTVPQWFGIGPEPMNGDGRRFYDWEGCYVTASGALNCLDATLESEMRERKKDFDSVTYERKGKGWFVLSGYKGNDILYLKVYVGPGAINTLYIQYPASMKEYYDEVVTNMSRSFQPGKLD